MNSTEHNPSLYADSSSAGQQNFSPIIETECSLPCTQQPASGPYLNPDEHSSQSFSAHLILLDFITHTILGKEYRSLSSSLCTTEYQTVYEKPLNVIMNVSNPPYGHKMSAYALIKTDKI